MTTVIQISLVVMLVYIMWCEYSPFFKDSVVSVSIRLMVSTVLLAACYHTPKLEQFSYDIQFSAMVVSLLVLFLSLKFILHKYNSNRIKALSRIKIKRGYDEKHRPI